MPSAEPTGERTDIGPVYRLDLRKCKILPIKKLVLRVKSAGNFVDPEEQQ